MVSYGDYGESLQRSMIQATTLSVGQGPLEVPVWAKVVTEVAKSTWNYGNLKSVPFDWGIEKKENVFTSRLQHFL